MEVLTLEKLKAMARGKVIAQGETIDGPEGCNLAGTGKTIRWIAVRGDITDWTIYAQNSHYIDSDDPDIIAVGYAGVWSYEKIRREGDKVHSPKNIKHLVPCDDKAFAMYRH